MIPIKNQAYVLYPIVLIESLTGDLKIDPTIAAGDFKVSTDESTFVNLATLPVVSPSGSPSVKISLDDDEMNGDIIQIYGKDVAGGEWDDVLIDINIPETINNVVFFRDMEDGKTFEQQIRLINDLQEADLSFDQSAGLLHIYKRGTTTDLIPVKTVAGVSVAQDTSLTE